MKTRLTALAIAVIMTMNLGYGQAPQKKFATLEQKAESAKKNYMVALHSENTGLIESTIKMIAKMKLQVPSTDVTELQEQLAELSVSHASATVRYKAYIATSICADPEWYAQENSVVTADQNQFFIAAANRLQQKLFGLRLVEPNSF